MAGQSDALAVVEQQQISKAISQHPKAKGVSCKDTPWW
jgi:hypothetical protein